MKPYQQICPFRIPTDPKLSSEKGFIQTWTIQVIPPEHQRLENNLYKWKIYYEIIMKSNGLIEYSSVDRSISQKLSINHKSVAIIWQAVTVPSTWYLFWWKCDVLREIQVYWTKFDE